MSNGQINFLLSIVLGMDFRGKEQLLLGLRYSWKTIKVVILRLDVVAHIYNPSTLGGTDRRIA